MHCGLSIRCGSFSYAEIPKPYSQILGVTGTLDSLGDFEQSVIKKDYGIHLETKAPSMYGETQLRFRKKADVQVQFDTPSYFRQIAEEIQTAQSRGRAVLVFFESESKMDAWHTSQNAEGLTVKKVGLQAGDLELETAVVNATRSGSATLFSRVHGRGIDFKVWDETVEKNDGLHVVQTFLSENLSEEIQTKGRTARQQQQGTYKLLLLASELTETFKIKLEETELATQGEGKMKYDRWTTA